MRPMSLRISSLGLATALVVGCSEVPEMPEPDGVEVTCAIGAGSDFAEVCTLEQSADSSFLIHHPDGGFRRVTYNADKDEIGVGDGADVLRVSGASTSEIAEFTIGEDRYRIPSAMLRAPSQ